MTAASAHLAQWSSWCSAAVSDDYRNGGKRDVDEARVKGKGASFHRTIGPPRPKQSCAQKIDHHARTCAVSGSSLAWTNLKSRPKEAFGIGGDADNGCVAAPDTWLTVLSQWRESDVLHCELVQMM